MNVPGPNTRAIYAGPVRPSTGEPLFPGYALGSEHFESPDGLGGWARYDGTGSIDDAANFACVNPD